MDKSSVIHYLRIQELQLENQLKALRQTMALLEGGQAIADFSSTANTNAPSSGDMPADSSAVEPEEQKGPKTKLVGKPELNGRKVRPVKLPKKYDASLSYTRKLAFLLSTEGPQTSQGLIKLVSEREPNEGHDKIARSVTITASAMYRKGLVSAKRKGRAYVYSI